MDYVQLIVTGIANGCVYGLVALGFVLIYKATEMVNFAQGDLMMFGAFIAFTLSTEANLPYPVVIIGTIVLMAALGIILERGILRPMIGEPPFAVLMLTIGLGFVLRAIAGTIWGHQPNQLVTPYSGGIWEFFGVRLDYEKLVIVGGTGVLCTLIYLFFKFTRIGVAMQAASQNQLAAYYVGIPVGRVVSVTWGISAGIAAVAAVMVAPLWWIEPGLGLVGIKAFVAAIVGGFGSLPGAILGGIAIGLVEQLVGYQIPGYGETGAYIFLLLMLFIRPQGIIATLQRKKV